MTGLVPLLANPSHIPDPVERFALVPAWLAGAAPDVLRQILAVLGRTARTSCSTT
jgi:hypothetical protein